MATETILEPPPLEARTELGVCTVTAPDAVSPRRAGPPPVVFAVANMDFAKAGDRRHVEHLAARAAGLGLVECKDLSLGDLAPDGWTAHQWQSRQRRPRRRRARDAARAGNGLLLDDRVLRARAGAELQLRIGVRPFIGRRRVKMLTRYIATLSAENAQTGEPWFLVVVHFPPERYARLRGRLVRRLARILDRHPNAVVFTDANMAPERLLAMLEARTRSAQLTVFGDEVMALLWNRDRFRPAEMGVDTWARKAGLTGHPDLYAGLSRRPITEWEAPR